MKVIFTLVFMVFCLSVMEGHSENGIQNPKAKVQLKEDYGSLKQANSISSNSININGQLNAVSITDTDPLSKNLDVKDKKAIHTIKINGDSNSVNINQNIHTGNVNIQQNGNGNQVNVLQSKIKAIRQEE